MEISNRITPAVIQGITAMLSPYCPEISPQSLIRAIREYNQEPQGKAQFPQTVTRAKAAELLDVSLPTINRLLNQGRLQRIRITAGCVRIDAESVKALLQPANGVEVEQ